MTTLAGLTHVSATVDVGGPVHYVDYGGPADGPLVVAVHGLGGSHLNWAAVAPYLVDHSHLVALDLLGHGRTRRPAGAPTSPGTCAWSRASSTGWPTAR